MAVTRSMSAIKSNTDSSSNNRNSRNVNSTKNQNRKKKDIAFKVKKQEVIDDVKHYLDVIKEMNDNCDFSHQSKNDTNPEFMSTIYNLYDTMIDNREYILSKDKSCTLYRVSLQKLYHIIHSIFKNYQRPDLAYELYYKYCDFFDLSFNKCFLIDAEDSE